MNFDLSLLEKEKMDENRQEEKIIIKFNYLN